MTRRTSFRAWGALLLGILIGAGAIVPAGLALAPSSASAADPSTFDPGYIISDANFYDANAMTAGEIQGFLDAQIGRCGNGACLNVLNVSFPGAARYTAANTGNLVCGAVPAQTVPVSQFIFQVQQACGISARAILVTLQKEEALITGPAAQAPGQGRLNIAMGYACPDTAACDTRYYGVANQIYWGAWQFKIYSAGKFFRQPGLNYIQFSPAASCQGTTVNIRDYATAALYNYTPYQPNAAAMANIYGSGDGCSSYGNRNFWRYYSDWFGNPAGNPPIGWMDTATVSGSSVVVSGWAIDPDLPLGSASVQLTVDGVAVASGYASQNRPGLGAATIPAAGDKHGYTLSAAVGLGAHLVCVRGLDSGGASPSTLSHTGSDAINNCAGIIVSAPPVGWMDSAQVLGSRVTAAGWAIDPDTSAAVPVQLTIDGVTAATGTANIPKPGLAAALGSNAGDDHGFALTGTLPVGRHTVCVTATNNAPGPVGTMRYAGAGAANNCAVVDYPGPRSPIGWMDSVALVGSRLTVGGWAIDPDTASAVPVRLLVDGAVVANATADITRSGLGAATIPAVGDAHGFTMSATLAQGSHTACISALDDAGGPASRLLYSGAGATGNCAVVTYAGPRPPFGWLDSVTVSGAGITAVGWAIDPDTSAPIQVRLTVDGTVVASGAAGSQRTGLGAVYPGSGDLHGYSLSSNVGAGSHTVCVIAVNDTAGPNTTLSYAGKNASNNCAIVVSAPNAAPVGWMDSATVTGASVSTTGWALDPDTSTAITVRMTIDGVVAATGTAAAARPGLAAAIGRSALGDDHGFALTAPIASGRHTVCMVGVDANGGADSALSYGGPGGLDGCAVVTR